MLPTKKNYANAYNKKGMLLRWDEREKNRKESLKKRKEKKESKAENIHSRHPEADPLSVRGATEGLIGKGNIAEKIIAFGEEFNKKQAEKRKLKKEKEKMKKRAKKLDEYKGYT